MTACAVCNAPPPLTLTRHGLRCSKCLLGELELHRGIVSDLATCDEPLTHAGAKCALCGAERNYLAVSKEIPHAEFCPWPRAVEASR